ncbi:melanoma-associated antigen B3-like [Phyllostomus discolor]|uniref:Melanoma-associated antigen B3-like n=1 Tax=Phyllostomus discolor TaxID=89673 RepID=A0A6J2MIS7_9CHIR|nr:melanoma-associated antigen B3-like [Phyllostomus discolor]
MPQGHKRKLHIPAEHHQAQGATQHLGNAKEEALASSSPPPSEAATQKKPGARSRSPVKWLQRALSTIIKSAGVSNVGLSEGANCKMKNKPSSSKAPPSMTQSQRDRQTEMTCMVVQFLMQMYKMKQSIRKADTLKIVSKKYKKLFYDILRRASSSKEVVFGADLKEVDATQHSCTLVSEMNLPGNQRVSGGSRGFPKYGLLMNILGMIFKNSNCATERKICEFLNNMTLYAGKRHFSLREPKKLITQDSVKLKYLEYRRVPDSDPPRYEFLWGPRAHAGTSKMRVLEFGAKINHTVPCAFLSRCEEALGVEEKSKPQCHEGLAPMSWQ